MGKSAFGTIRHLPSGKYQARVRLRGRQITLGSFGTRREAQAVIARSGAEAHGSSIFDRSKGRERVEHFAERWWLSRLRDRVECFLSRRVRAEGELLAEVRHPRLPLSAWQMTDRP
jgi:hypothetical protein